MPNDPRNQSGGMFGRDVPQDTQILGTTGIVQPTSHRLLPHTAFYVVAADTLLLNVTPEGIAATLLLNYRLLLPDGTIQTAQETMQVAANFSEQTKSIALVEGWLLSVTVECNTAQIPTGSLYVQVFLIRGAFGNLVWPTLLLGEYANSFYHLAWPGSPVLQPVYGRGWARTQVGPAVGAGASIVLVLDIHHRFAIDFVSVKLVTSAAAANRSVFCELFDGTRTFALAGTNVLQAASLTKTYWFGKGLQFDASSVTQVTAPLWLDQESAADAPLTVTVAALNQDVGDQFSSLFVRTRQWQESD